MSKKLFLMIVLVVLLATPVLWSATQSADAAPPQQESSQRTITVTGSGTAYGAPDIVTVGLGVETSNADILAAMDDTNARMNAVLQAVQDNGVAPEDIRTDHFSIYQDYSYGGPMEPAVNGQPAPAYRVSTGVTVTVRNTDSVGELLSSAVAAGANMVNYIQFDIEDRGALEADARELAVADAQARAAHLAGSLGLTVGEPLSITENTDYYSPMMGGGGGLALEAAAISQGTLSVNMSVTITFALKSGS